MQSHMMQLYRLCKHPCLVLVETNSSVSSLASPNSPVKIESLGVEVSSRRLEFSRVESAGNSLVKVSIIGNFMPIYLRAIFAKPLILG